MTNAHDILRDLGLSALNSGGSTGKSWWASGAQAGLLQSINPATGDVLAQVRLCSDADYRHIAQQAEDSFKSWRLVPAPRRGEFVRLVGQALREKKDRLGTLVSLEVGKIKAEGNGEVQEMIDMADFAVGQSRLLSGATMQSERAQHRMY
jgi:aldehyde dehydrogenase (NAD+)